MAPILVECHWCLYIWDFERKKVVVLDPKFMKLGNSVLEDKHKGYILLLNSGMNECWRNLANSNNNNIDNWDSEYIDVIGGEANR